MTAKPHELDLALGLLDHQLVDSEGRRCGKVDDLDLDAKPGGEAHATAILVGTGYWAMRLHGPFRRMARRLGGSTVRIGWEDISDVGSAVHLKQTANELRLGRGDDRARRWVEWIPRAR